MNHVLGIDTSTTATKAILVDENGEVRGVASSTYGYETPHPLWAEQDPDIWTHATDAAIRELLAETGVDPATVTAVGVTGQMHGMCLLASDGRPLRPAILWNDQRTAAECDEIRELVGAERLVEVTGNDAMPGFTAPKVLWVRNHERHLFERARRLLLPKDFVRHHLTGDYATDKAGAAGTLLVDLHTRTWSDEVVAALEIPPSWLPPTFEGPEGTGTISDHGADLTGLRPGTPVVAGGGDQAASAVGTGVVDPGVMTASLGTSGVVFAATDEPAVDPRGRIHAFPHAVPERWHLMGVMLAAAGSLQWLRDALAPDTPFDTLVAQAEKVELGADGLVFLPYLSGERTPHVDPLARGAFVGLTTRHGLPHMVRAVLEGVSFGLRDSLDLMIAAGVPHPTEVRISGGGARSELWRSIVADVLGADVTTVNTTEGAAYGAALLAAVGAGWFQSVGEGVTAWVRVTGRTPHDPARHNRYRTLHGVFQDLYPALQPSFGRLGNGDLTTPA